MLEVGNLMTSPTQLYTEFAVAVGASTVTATAVNADALITALITFGVSLVTLAGGELIKYLVAFFKKKTDDLNKDEKKGEDKNG